MSKKLTFLFLISSLISLQAQNINRFIEVVGTAEIKVKADQIEISVGVRTVEPTLQESKEEIDKVFKNVLNILSGFGNDIEEIETAPISFGINYSYENNEREADGYYAASTVSFKLVEINKYYNLIDKLMCAENISINGSVYNNSEYEKYNQQAYENSVVAARQKAEYMARVASVTIGPVLEIEDNSTSGAGLRPNYPNPFNKSISVNSNSNQAFGSIEIRRSVRIKFELVE